MKTKPDILSKILISREKRAELRQKISAKKECSVSINLNIPGYPKSSRLYNSFFNEIIIQVERHFIAHRIFWQDKTIQTDEAGDFFIASIKQTFLSPQQIKTVAEKFESGHSIGRFIDIDITDASGNIVSSGKLKKCFYCDKNPALVCMRNNTHTAEELRQYQRKKIQQYLYAKFQNKLIKKLHSIALQSILYEITLTPKPGLVDTNSSGAHTDMNFQSFVDSTAAISVYFDELAKIGFTIESESEILPAIREIGLQMEKDMFSITHGVNTQKGIIFLMGICLAATTFIIRKEKQFSLHSFQKTVSAVNQGITEQELIKFNNKSSHGEICFSQYGNQYGGIRQEVELGFPTVINHALPFLLNSCPDNIIYNSNNDNISVYKTLLKIISVSNDTNIIHRQGPSSLKKIKKMCMEILEEKHPDIFNNKREALADYFKKHNISPGGSADLLSISIYLYKVLKTSMNNEF
ncbi:MAG: hypothetical protein C0594_12975 [Marinilabiliales bacterium]|nr:MAG: hypothetical protein C0594_12975 [Marinilabiliales bacterium]